MISENTCPSFGDLKGDSSADKKISAEGIKTDCRGIFEKMPSRKTNEIKGLKTAIFSVRYDKTGEKGQTEPTRYLPFLSPTILLSHINKWFA